MVPGGSRRGALALGLLVILAGCSAALPGPQSAAAVLEEARADYAAVDSYEARLVTTVFRGADRQRLAVAVAARPHARMVRQEYLAPPGKAGDVVVSDGETIWRYNATEDRVVEGDVSNLDAVVLGPNYTRLLNRTGERYNLTYRGTATVAGRETHVVVLEPRNETTAAFLANQTLWIDRERGFPVRGLVVFNRSDERAGFRWVYRNLSFDTGVDNRTFEWDGR